MISKSKLNELSRIQKQCVRLVAKKSMGTDPTPFFTSLKIHSILALIRLALCKIGHNISHKYWPEPLIDLFNKFGGKKQHRYPTRNKHIPNIQRHQSDQYKNSFLCGSIREYSKLPANLRQQTNSNLFIRQLKQTLNYC